MKNYHTYLRKIIDLVECNISRNNFTM